MADRVQLTVDVGANAPVEVIRALFDSLDTVCQLGASIAYRSAVNIAELRAYASNSRSFEEMLDKKEDRPSGSPPMPTDSLMGESVAP